MAHDVFLILDPDFSTDLWSLSRGSHVWLIQSPHNDLAVQAVWERETGGYTLLRGVTRFKGSGELTESFYDTLNTIDQHHVAPAWDAIRVIGISLDDVHLDRVAKELGDAPVELVVTDRGFTIQRATAAAEP